jgi:hypothetical protein
MRQTKGSRAKFFLSNMYLRFHSLCDEDERRGTEPKYSGAKKPVGRQLLIIFAASFVQISADMLVDFKV